MSGRRPGPRTPSDTGHKVAKDVLVIAADGALRRSLEFLFEAEGLEVSSHADLALTSRATAKRSRCLVVDESALVEGSEDWAPLFAFAESIVVLFSRAVDLPANLLIRAVQKPLMGVELVETVRMLLAGKVDAA
jgi:hypothetical protein